MLKKDMLVRQFEEMGKVLAALLTFKRNNEWDLFEKELAEAVKRYTPLEIGAVEDMELEEFEKQIIVNDKTNFEQKKILATLLFEKMNFYLSRDSMDEYERLKEKCLRLYEYLANDLTENEYNLDIHYKLRMLREAD
jgi:hypothetical protein